MDIDGRFLAKRKRPIFALRANKTGSNVREACLLFHGDEISSSVIRLLFIKSPHRGDTVSSRRRGCRI
ncbi:hypothetical protein AVEN_210533-1, partial [Araneus ventricosus]